MDYTQIKKAQPTGSYTPPDCTIEIFPAIGNHETIESTDEEFVRDARYLEAALYDHLPGGTYDRLLGEMLKRKASHFIVAHRGE